MCGKYCLQAAKLEARYCIRKRQCSKRFTLSLRRFKLLNKLKNVLRPVERRNAWSLLHWFAGSGRLSQPGNSRRGSCWGSPSWTVNYFTSNLVRVLIDSISNYTCRHWSSDVKGQHFQNIMEILQIKSLPSN